MDKDIVKAIEAEQEYIQTSNSDEFPLRNRVAHFGYDNLDDYFHDKIKYQIVNENITIQYDTVEITIDNLYKAFNTGTPSAFSIKEDYNRTWIWAGKDNQFLNIDKANELGYTIRNFNYNGGPIITCNEDFNLALIIPNYIDLDVKLVTDEVKSLLISKGLNVKEDNNDLLINDYKILGSIVCKNDKAQLIAFELSLSDNTSLAKELSTKESNKQPSYIVGINRTELEGVFDKWLHTI